MPMILDVVILLAALLCFVYFVFLRKRQSASRKVSGAPLIILFAIQIFFIIWSFYILKTAEGFDGMLVILTIPPAIILAPIIIILGHYQYKNSIDRSILNRLIVFLNAAALAGLVFAFVYFSYFVTE